MEFFRKIVPFTFTDMIVLHLSANSAPLRCSFLVLFLVLLPSLLSGQRRERGGIEQPLPFQVETFNFPSTDPSQSRLDVLFTIDLAAIVFVRSAEGTRADDLTGGIEVSIDVVDSATSSAASKVLRKDFVVPDTQQVKRKPWKGMYSFHLLPGTYTVTIEISDIESQRSFKTQQTVTLRSYAVKEPRASSILWLIPGSGETDSSGWIYGKTIPLGASADGYFEWSGPTSDSLSARVVIYRIGMPEEGRTMVFSNSTVKPAGDTFLTITQRDDGWQGYSLTSNPATRGFICPVPSETFPQGRYEAEITVHNGSQTTTVTEPLTIRWMNMPVSLRSLATAVPPLKHIMTEQEYAAIRELNNEDQRKMLEQYWKLKDPTPKNVFNEMMDEFYRRVDEAIQQFQTIKQPNGSLSDRGKTYILYGQPTSQDRVFGLNSAPREVWFYKNLNRSFIFVDEKRSGDYKLASEQ